MHDYLVSNESSDLVERMRSRMIQNLKDQGMDGTIDERVIKIMAGVRAHYLLAAFDEIDASFGGMEGYFEELGVTSSDQKQLSKRLLR